MVPGRLVGNGDVVKIHTPILAGSAYHTSIRAVAYLPSAQRRRLQPPEDITAGSIGNQQPGPEYSPVGCHVPSIGTVIQGHDGAAVPGGPILQLPRCGIPQEQIEPAATRKLLAIR